MLCFRFHRKFLTQVFTNKEKILHLACACIFLYLIKELQNFQKCHYEIIKNTQTTPKSGQNPPKVKIPKHIDKEEIHKEVKKDNDQIIKKTDLGKLLIYSHFRPLEKTENTFSPKRL
jgi:hypothetical protein